MRKVLLVCGMLTMSVSVNAQSYRHSPYRQPPRIQGYSPYYGYSYGQGTRYGNSAPYQGNFRFAPGFGYGSIYGNSGHPGFRTYRGPSYGW